MSPMAAAKLCPDLGRPLDHPSVPKADLTAAAGFDCCGWQADIAACPEPDIRDGRAATASFALPLVIKPR